MKLRCIREARSPIQVGMRALAKSTSYRTFPQSSFAFSHLHAGEDLCASSSPSLVFVYAVRGSRRSRLNICFHPLPVSSSADCGFLEIALPFPSSLLHHSRNTPHTTPWRPPHSKLSGQMRLLPKSCGGCKSQR